MASKTFTERAYDIAQKQALYWLEHGNDAEEAAQWLNIVFAIEDRLNPEVAYEIEDEDDEEAGE